jgi:endonuclease YncB( thermonuclease family)
MSISWRLGIIAAFIALFILFGKLVYGDNIPLVPIVLKTHSHFGLVTQVYTAEVFRIEGADGSLPVRLFGIDCTSKCKQPACVQAQKDAFDEVKRRLNKNNIILECDGYCRFDRQKRRFHYVVLPDIPDFGALLIRQGLCATAKYVHPRREAQKIAQEARLGRWQ